MDIQIAEMRPEDADAKGYVHWKSWQETYTGLMPEKYLANQTLEKCQTIARRWPDNTLLLKLDGRAVGFACYNRNDCGSGEIIALYLLKGAQGFGLGRKLMDAALHKLCGCTLIALWVLKGNDHAIGFYEHCGFRLDGVEKELPFGIELRMTYVKEGACL